MDNDREGLSFLEQHAVRPRPGMEMLADWAWTKGRHEIGSAVATSSTRERGSLRCWRIEHPSSGASELRSFHERGARLKGVLQLAASNSLCRGSFGATPARRLSDRGLTRMAVFLLILVSTNTRRQNCSEHGSEIYIPLRERCSQVWEPSDLSSRKRHPDEDGIFSDSVLFDAPFSLYLNPAPHPPHNFVLGL